MSFPFENGFIARITLDKDGKQVIDDLSCCLLEFQHWAGASRFALSLTLPGWPDTLIDLLLSYLVEPALHGLQEKINGV
jgi:hypothetical protein